MPKKRTTYKKTVTVIPVPQTSLVKLKFKGGGELPNRLKGSFTTKELALKAFERYKLNKGIK